MANNTRGLLFGTNNSHSAGSGSERGKGIEAIAANGEYVINFRYAVFLGSNYHFPSRGMLFSCAWGSLPASYFQDDEALEKCSFIDMKVNKWEVNERWRLRQADEPWIRVELVRGDDVAEYLAAFSSVLPAGRIINTVALFDMDEGAEEVDEILLLRIAFAFSGGDSIYLTDGSVVDADFSLLDSSSVDAIIKRISSCY